MPASPGGDLVVYDDTGAGRDATGVRSEAWYIYLLRLTGRGGTARLFADHFEVDGQASGYNGALNLFFIFGRAFSRLSPRAPQQGWGRQRGHAQPFSASRFPRRTPLHDDLPVAGLRRLGRGELRGRHTQRARARLAGRELKR